MTRIDRTSAHDAARRYAQNSAVSRAIATRQIAVQPTGRAHQHTRVQTATSMSLSATARSIAAARSAVQRVPDARLKKLADVKQQLSDGTYQVSLQTLARNMLASADA